VATLTIADRMKPDLCFVYYFGGSSSPLNAVKKDFCVKPDLLNPGLSQKLSCPESILCVYAALARLNLRKCHCVLEVPAVR
jgi:hypothetical protein